MNLTYFEQRATIYYIIDTCGYITYKRFTGWVMLSHNNIVAARKIGGRNRYSICHAEDIYKIEPAPTKGNRS